MKLTSHLKPRRIVTLPLLLLVVAAWLWHRMPATCGPLTKQTLFVALADALGPHSSADDRPRLLWIDDDGGDGLFVVRQLCLELGIKATFAVVPTRLTRQQADSLACWQREGYGIALHGLRHDRWHDWSEQQVAADLQECRRELSRQGLDTLLLRPLVVPPHGANTRAVRSAVSRSGCQMVTGAHLINPDRECRLLGRLWLDRESDTARVSALLVEAARRRSFVVVGTHASNAGEFSAEAVRHAVVTARRLGFAFD